MSAASTVLIDAFGRVRDGVLACLQDVSGAALRFRPEPDANSVGWLVWHLTRVQDDHVAAAFDQPQLWHSGGWADRFALPYDDTDTGYGHTSGEVGALEASAELLRGYHEAVHEVTVRCLEQDPDLDRVVDQNWDPPVTLGTRLVSVISDDLQHVGQAAYALGLWESARA